MFIINKSVYFVPIIRTNVAIIMIASFTESEKRLLKGQKSGIAKKHGCSAKYVELIIKGQRSINFPLANSIHADLLRLVEILRPRSKQ